MTISKKLQLTINPSNGSLYVNTAWDKLNPLYCANQQYAYANLSGSNTYNNTFVSISPSGLCITSNNQSTDKLFVHYSYIPNSSVGRFISFKADYSTNTVTYLNESYNGLYNSDIYNLSDNRFMMLSSTANNTLRAQLIIVNNDTGAISAAAANTLLYSSNNTANYANARYTISQVSNSKYILYYVDSTTGANTGSIKAAVVDVANNGNISFGTPLVIASNPTAFIGSLSLTSRIKISNTHQVLGVRDGSNTSQMYYHNIGISGNTLSLGTNSTSNTAYGNFESIGDDYYLGNMSAGEYVIHISSNVTTYITQTTVSRKADESSPVPDISYNNNQFGHVHIIQSETSANTKLNVTRFDKSTNTLTTSNSDFSVFEISGKYSPASSRFFPSGKNSSIYYFDSLLGTTRGLVVSVEIPGPIYASNTLPIIYRFIDGNTNSQTISYSSPGSNSFISPAAGQVFIQCFGPGGRGRLSNPNTQTSSTGYGGGGGGYAHKILSVTSSQNIGLVVGRSSNSTQTSTNSTANTILCRPGGDATTSTVGVSGNASGGDINANGQPGTTGAYTVAKGFSDASLGGLAGSPGPARTGSGLQANTRSYVDGCQEISTGAEGKSQGTGGYRGELGVLKNGEVIIGFKPS